MKLNSLLLAIATLALSIVACHAQTNVRLTWDAPTDSPTYYVLEHRQGTNAFQRAYKLCADPATFADCDNSAPVDFGQTRQIDQSVTQGTGVHDWRLFAGNAFGLSLPSNTASVNTALANPPTGLRVVVTITVQ